MESGPVQPVDSLDPPETFIGDRDEDCFLSHPVNASVTYIRKPQSCKPVVSTIPLQSIRRPVTNDEQNMQEVDEELFGNGNPGENEVNAALEQEFIGDLERFLAIDHTSAVVFLPLQDHIPESDWNIQIPPAEMESGPVQLVDPLDILPDASFDFEKIVPENLGNNL
ncbi:unnamed protein product, partial [Mesorhabditis belari]|uniref:Securin n=1 Tax=Mesorhabditis belari TaxID=2138241 RepID=A0AAF3EN31_9BILA